MHIFLLFHLSDEERRANEEAISVLREEIYCLERQIDVLQEEWDDTTRWAEGGGDSRAAAALFAAISVKRVNLQIKVEDARRRLLDVLANSY